MIVLQVGLATSTLLSSLVAGLVFAFAVVAMPGLGRLNDRDFLRAFQVVDRVIQNNQPVFMLVWVGSVVALIASSALGLQQLEGVDRALILGANLTYLLGVQLPTFVVNVPLNNRVQALEIGELSDEDLAQARRAFEDRWNRWNTFRTTLACATVSLLLLLLMRL